jgi:ribosomal protein L37AE/L43A
MSNLDDSEATTTRPSNKDEVTRRSNSCEEAMICERCGKAEMYRMHAVWRCPECGFKTDCCGW